MRRRTIGFEVIRAEKRKELEKDVNKIQKRFRVILENLKREQSKPMDIMGIIPVFSTIIGSEDASPDQIIPWIDAPTCSFCNTQFTVLNRKHHCRLCGQILCQSCSLFIDTIRTCSSCSYLASFRKPEPSNSDMQKYYDTYIRYKNAIHGLLPQYNNLVSLIKAKGVLDYRDQEYQLALKVRKEVMDMGVEIEQIAKKVQNLDGRLGSRVCMGMAMFLKETVGRMELMPLRSSDKERGKVPNPKRVGLEESREMLKTMLGDAMARRKLEDAEAIKEQLQELEDEMAKLDMD
jgi:rabenosyn-5